MIGKKINQLATELAPTTTDLTIIGDPVTGVSKKITLEQLGAIFGGAVSFYTTLGDFPATGVIDIIYCAKDTKKLYLWSGSAYVEVFPSQSLLDTYQLRSEKGVSNGYASLDVNGKVPIGQLPNSIMEYKGTWNAATNTPTLANGTGDTGDVYICNAAGTVNFGAGPITFAVGDYVVYSGTIWQRSSGAVGTVTSVAVSRSGDALAITGSPITTSGTINIGFAGTGAQYIKGDGTLATFPSIISQAQNLVTEVYNNTGATLTKGTIVYINGGQGNLPTVTKALATGDSTSAQTYGVVQTDITNMNNGYVVVAGRLTDLDTQAYSNGTQLYLSSTTAGTWTPTKQYAPNHLVYVGIVVRSHPTQGVVEIKIQNGYELDELHNVAAQSPDNNDILQYKTATSLWTKVAGTTTNIAEGTNLYYTDARSRAALSFTAGSGAYNSTTGVITIPTNTNQLTNGAAFITLASLSAGAGISYNNTTGVIASTITQYTDALARAAISLTTTGTSGAATYNNTTGILNIPQYQTALTNPVTGTGTTNYLPKFTGTSTIGNSTIFDNGTNVGIGTATPSYKLDVTGAIQTSVASGNGSLYINNSSLSGKFWTLIPETASGETNLLWYYGGAGASVKMNLTNSGNLGLGVTPSAWGTDFTRNVLQFGGSVAGVGALWTNRFNNGVFLGNNVYDDGVGNNRYILNGTSTIYVQASGQHYWQTAPSGTAGNAISFTQAMTLDASGRLGIGQTSPGGFLEVSSANSGNTQMLLVRNFATSATGNFTGNYTAEIRGASNSNLTHTALIHLQENNVARRVLDVTSLAGTVASFCSNGNVGIGTTSPTEILHLNKTSGTGTFIRFQDTGGDGVYVGSRSNNLELYAGGAERMRITSGGNVGLGGITNPQTQLHLNGTITFTESGFNTVRLNQIQSSHSDGSSPNNNIRFLVSNGSGTTAERMRINGDGALQVTSTIQTGAPSSGSAHAWKLGSYAAGGTGTATGVIYIEVNGQIYSIPALLGTP